MGEYYIIPFEKVKEFDDKKATLFLIAEQWKWIPDSCIGAIDVNQNVVDVKCWFCENEGLYNYSIGERD